MESTKQSPKLDASAGTNAAAVAMQRLSAYLAIAAEHAAEITATIEEAAIPLLITAADLAALRGTSRQREHTRLKEGRLPPPNFWVPSFGDHWHLDAFFEPPPEEGSEVPSPETLYAVADVASRSEPKLTAPAIMGRIARGTFPIPAYRSRVAGRLWRPQTLVERGIIPETEAS